MTDANDLAILFPERHVTVAGVDITMREYGFAESLQHAGLIAKLTDAIAAVALRRDFHDLDSLREAFGACHAEVRELIAIACDQPLDWVSGLKAAEGEVLMALWWDVNTDFFLRRVLQSVRLRKLREVAGLTSSAPSSPMGTTRDT